MDQEGTQENTEGLLTENKYESRVVVYNTKC